MPAMLASHSNGNLALRDVAITRWVRGGGQICIIQFTSGSSIAREIWPEEDLLRLWLCHKFKRKTVTTCFIMRPWPFAWRNQWIEFRYSSGGECETYIFTMSTCQLLFGSYISTHKGAHCVWRENYKWMIDIVLWYGHFGQLVLLCVFKKWGGIVPRAGDAPILLRSICN